MSKVIKSSFAETKEEKTIKLRSFTKEPLLEVKTGAAQVEADMSKQYEAFQCDLERQLEHAKKEAEAIVQQANDEAEQTRLLIEQKKVEAKQEIELSVQEAKERGYKDGYQQGTELGKSEYEMHIQQAHDVIGAAKQEYLSRLEQAEPTIVELAIAVTEKMVGQLIHQEEHQWTEAVKQALTEVREYDEIKIYVPPHWYERTLQQKEELLTLLSHGQELAIYPDSHLSEFGCIIETPFGRIDASVDSQLIEMKAQLLEKLQEESDGRS